MLSEPRSGTEQPAHTTTVLQPASPPPRPRPRPYRPPGLRPVPQAPPQLVRQVRAELLPAGFALRRCHLQNPLTSYLDRSIGETAHLSAESAVQSAEWRRQRRGERPAAGPRRVAAQRSRRYWQLRCGLCAQYTLHCARLRAVLHGFRSEPAPAKQKACCDSQFASSCAILTNPEKP